MPPATHAPKSGSESESVELLIEAVLVPEDNGQWSAVALDYCVVGYAPTADEAKEQMLSMVGEYLLLGLRDGETLEELRRPISKRWRYSLMFRVYLSRLLRQRQGRPASPEQLPLHSPVAC